MNEDKKVILIKGGNSKWFEQAIFILKDKEKMKNAPKNFVEEAEKIINNYMMKKYPGNNFNKAYSKSGGYSHQGKAPLRPPKSGNEKSIGKKKKYDKILNISIISLCILIGLILYHFG